MSEPQLTMKLRRNILIQSEDLDMMAALSNYILDKHYIDLHIQHRMGNFGMPYYEIYVGEEQVGDLAAAWELLTSICADLFYELNEWSESGRRRNRTYSKKNIGASGAGG